VKSGRWHRSAGVLAGALLGSLLVAGCQSGTAPSPSPSTASATAAGAACNVANPSPAPQIPPLSTVVGIDHGPTAVALLTAPAPGGGLAYLVACRYERGAGAGEADTAGGTVDAAFEGTLSVDRRVEVDGPPEEHVLAGRLRGPAAQVSVQLSDGTSAEAAVKDGYWIAWWSGQASATTVRGIDAGGEVVASDAPVPGPS
jgi:hypothetical protein